MELLRRLLTLLLLFPGLAFVLQPGGMLLILSKVDFALEQSRNPYFHSSDETLDAFIQRRTSGRMAKIPPESFDRLVGLLNQTNPNPPEILQRLSEQIILRPEILPLDAPDPVSYLHDSRTGQWLRLQQIESSGIPGLAPELRHPRRRAGLLLLALAPGVYLLLPRRKAAPDDIRYARAASVVLPDLLGFALYALFFGFALLASSQIPQDGWTAATGMLLLIALLPLSLPLIAAHYAGLSFRLSEAALLRVSGSRKQSFAWANMQSCRSYTGKTSRRIGLMLFLLGRGPGMKGQGLLVAANVEHGVEIVMRNGQKLRIMANALPGFQEIIHALETHSVPGVETLGTFPSP